MAVAGSHRFMSVRLPERRKTSRARILTTAVSDVTSGAPGYLEGLSTPTTQSREEFLRELLDTVHERYSVLPPGNQITSLVNKRAIRQAKHLT